MESCCNFNFGRRQRRRRTSTRGVAAMAEDLASADILVSLRSRARNAIFAEDGVVLVELHGSYGADDVIFRRLAQGRRGYLRARVVETPEHTICLPSEHQRSQTAL